MGGAHSKAAQHLTLPGAPNIVNCLLIKGT